MEFNNASFPVQKHYGTTDLVDLVNRALAEAGRGTGRLGGADLAPLDQFHVRGSAATEELARSLHLTKETMLLDIGCGLGGPARYLAATYGCYVTGIDLSQPFVDVAQLLAERTGLAGCTTFLQGDALHLPFPAAHFDCAWTQHVAMNLADKQGFYEGVYKVLKPGGTFAIYDVIEGNGEPLHFPVPWARTPEISFLLSEAAMKKALHEAGFVEREWTDTTSKALSWFAEPANLSAAPATGSLSLASIMGPEFGIMAANFGRNLREGRAKIVQAIVGRD